MQVISTMGDRDRRRDSSASNVSRREDLYSLPFFYSNFKSTDEVACYIKKCSRKKPGYYLLRPSNRQRNLLTASVSVKDGSVRHLHIQIEENDTNIQYFLVVEKKFGSIIDLLDFYRNNPVRNLENVDDVYFKFSLDRPGSKATLGSQSASGGSLGRSRSVTSMDSNRGAFSTVPAGPPPLPGRPRNNSTGSDTSSGSAWLNGNVQQENSSGDTRGAEAIANRPPAPLPAGAACSDYGAYYSRARDVSEDISGKLKEVLNQSEVCECGISRNLAELPLGWTVHRSKDAATFGKLFYQSAEGQTSWFLPQNVKMQMTQKHMGNLRKLEGRSPKHSNSFNLPQNV